MLHFGRRGREKNCPTFKVGSHCSPVHLVGVHVREGNSLGVEEGKVLRSGLCYEQRKDKFCVLGYNPV
jgi:hypothetical protein